MEQEVEAFIFASPDIQEVLADSESDVADLLNETGLRVKRGFAKDPVADSGLGYKEPVSVILASAAVILSLTPIIKKVIEAVTHKTVVVHDLVCVPVEDSSGNVMLTTDGEPVLQWVRRAKIIESRRQRDVSDMSIKGPFGFELSFTDRPKE